MDEGGRNTKRCPKGNCMEAVNHYGECHPWPDYSGGASQEQGAEPTIAWYCEGCQRISNRDPLDDEGGCENCLSEAVLELIRRPPSGSAAPDVDWWQEYERLVDAFDLAAAHKEQVRKDAPRHVFAQYEKVWRDARTALLAHVRRGVEAQQREPDGWLAPDSPAQQREPDGWLAPDSPCYAGIIVNTRPYEDDWLPVYFGTPVPAEPTTGDVE